MYFSFIVGVMNESETGIDDAATGQKTATEDKESTENSTSNHHSTTNYKGKYSVLSNVELSYKWTVQGVPRKKPY